MGNTSVAQLLARVREWVASDPDETCRDELAALLTAAELTRTAAEAPSPAVEHVVTRSCCGSGGAAGPVPGRDVVAAARAELADRFAGTLQFGTAGLRGPMAAGPNRMNRAVVIRAAKGLIDYLFARHAEWGGRPPRVVIGNDARQHSREFALDTAAVVHAAGGEALLLPDQVPTPVLAFAVRHLDADAGVMVTASHNPAGDNGYKVYLGGRCVSEPERGVQLVPPYDAEIATRIAAAGPANAIPQSASGWTDVGPGVHEAYVDVIADPRVRRHGAESGSGLSHGGSTVPPGRCVRSWQAESGAGLSQRGPCASWPAAPPGPGEAEEAPPPGDPASIRIVHTALHGVGSATALAALARAGFADVVPVPEQQHPDPDFPTVAFPNPEEPGALDLALALAARVDADVVIANDPDADRCAVAVKDPRAVADPAQPDARPGRWRVLHGDELGAVLGYDAVLRIAAGRDVQTGGVLVNSVVSSRLLGQIAAAHGVAYERTLTGFKWMGRVPGLAYAYEEAIGYCVRPDIVRDKDGISAAVAIARLVARLAASGRTLIDLLDDLARAHNLYLTSQLALRFADLSQLPATVQRLREAPPATLAGSPVTLVADMAQGYEGLPPTDGVVLATAADDRVIVRPSGTEPKVKCYLEVVTPVAADATFAVLTQLRTQTHERLEAIKEDLRLALTAH